MFLRKALHVHFPVNVYNSCFVSNLLVGFSFLLFGKFFLSKNSIYEPERETETDDRCREAAAGICFHLNSSHLQKARKQSFCATENNSHRFIINNTRNKLKHNENNYPLRNLLAWEFSLYLLRVSSKTLNLFYRCLNKVLLINNL